MPKLWLEPSVVKFCTNCPAFKFVHDQKYKCKCDKFNEVIDRDTLENVIMNGKFPNFCKLEDVGW
jgi:hypothetical protein